MSDESGDRFFVHAVRKAVRLQREYGLEKRDFNAAPLDWLQSERRLRIVGERSVPRTRGAMTGEMSRESRRDLRWTYASRPWEMLQRSVMITLSYPGEWREFVPDGATLEAH